MTSQASCRRQTAFCFIGVKVCLLLLATVSLFVCSTSSLDAEILIGSKLRNGSFESTDPSTSPIQAGPRRASNGKASFSIPQWTLVNERGYAGVDGQAPASDGKSYAFVNQGAILSLTSENIAPVLLKSGDALRLTFKAASRKANDKATVRLSYILDEQEWKVKELQFDLPKADHFHQQTLTARLPISAKKLALRITLDNNPSTATQLRIDEIQLKRIPASQLPPRQNKYYVSQKGNNQNTGKIKSPLRSIQKAADLAQPGDTVFIEQGAYAEKVILRSSGLKNHPITFRPYKGHRVTVTTADPVTDWKRLTQDVNGDNKIDRDIWTATVNSNTGENVMCNTLFADGKLKFEARHFAENDPLEFDDWGKIKRGDLSFTSLRSENLKDRPKDFWKGGTVRHHTTDWSFSDSKIDRYDPETGTLHFAEKLGYIISQKQTFGFYIFNTIKALDKPGEWFKAENEPTLYYYSEPGQNPNESRIAFKTRDYTFDVRGQQHINLDGLILEGGAIQMDNHSEYIRFTNGKLFGYGKGGYGPYRLIGSHNTVEGNEIYQVYEAAASVDGDHHRIVNNYFHDITYRLDTRSLPMNGHSHLVSYNTFRKFARNFVATFPFKSEYSYNVFADGAKLSWDTAVFDGDLNTGDGGGCVIHHNVFRDSPAHGSYFAIYSGVDLVFHHNIIYNFRDEHRHRGMAQCMKFYHNSFIGGNPQGLRIGSPTPFQSAYCNNIQLTDQRVATLGVLHKGNHNHIDADFVNSAENDYRLTKGSQAIDIGIRLPGINDNFRGKAPDAGALEFGEAMWKYGHDFEDPPHITYSWKNIPGANLEENGQFEPNPHGSAWTHHGRPKLFNGNSWNMGYRGLSPTGGRSYKIGPTAGISRRFENTKPNTFYQVAVECRLVDEIIKIDKFHAHHGKITKGRHRGERYIEGLDEGEWLRFDNVQLGDTAKYNAVELSFSRPNYSTNREDAKNASLELRASSPTGPRLGTFHYKASCRDSWYTVKITDISKLKGSGSLFLVGKGKSSEKMRLTNLRFFHTSPLSSDKLTVKVSHRNTETIRSAVGLPYWRKDYESLSFKTGPKQTSIEVSLENHGIYDAYIDRFALVELPARKKLKLTSPSTQNLSPQKLPFHVKILHPQRLEEIHLKSLTTKGNNSTGGIRVSLWKNPKDPAPIWQRSYYSKKSPLAPHTLVIKSDELDDSGLISLGSQAAKYINVEALGKKPWFISSLQAYPEKSTDLVATDGTVTIDASNWECRFPQVVNLGELRLTPKKMPQPEAITLTLFDHNERQVWQKNFAKLPALYWTRDIVIDGSTLADDGVTRLSNVLAKRIVIKQENVSALSFSRVQARNQRDSPSEKNLALRAHAAQSSDYYGTEGPASEAINGIVFPLTDFTSSNRELKPWWEATLEKPSDIEQIVIYNRDGADKRIGHFRVSALNEKNVEIWGKDYSHSKGDLAHGNRLEINQSLRGVHKVRVQIHGKNLLHLTEVMIWKK